MAGSQRHPRHRHLKATPSPSAPRSTAKRTRQRHQAPRRSKSRPGRTLGSPIGHGESAQAVESSLILLPEKRRRNLPHILGRKAPLSKHSQDSLWGIKAGGPRADLFSWPYHHGPGVQTGHSGRLCRAQQSAELREHSESRVTDEHSGRGGLACSSGCVPSPHVCERQGGAG